MPFKTKKIKTDLNLAETLTKLRKKSGLPFAILCQELQIQLKYLKFLERGQYSQLPAPVYLKGFLRRYADFFKVPFNHLWQLYEKESSVLAKLKKPTHLLTLRRPLKSLKPLLTAKILTLGLAGLIFLGLVFYFGYQLNFLIKPPTLVLESPLSDLTTTENYFNLQGKVSTNAQLSINGQVVKTTKQGTFSYSLILAQGMNLIRFVAENPFGKRTEILRRVVLQ